MENTNAKKCLVCGSKDIVPLMECTDHFITHKHFCIAICKTCGFRFTSDAPAASEIGAYYKSDAYISHSDTRKGLINRLYHVVRTIMLGNKRRLIERLTNGKELLDIGCGTGHFLHYMEQKGFSCEGIEIDEQARNRAVSEFGLQVTGIEPIYNQPVTNKYDIITLWHVLEHLHDAGTYLTWIHQALKAEGTLLIALPNCSSLDATLYGRYWAAYDVPRHLWHFSPSVFERFICQYGFTLIQVKGMPYDAYYNSMMSAGYAGKRSPVWHGLLTGLYSNINSLFNSRRTSSVIYLLKKTY